MFVWAWAAPPSVDGIAAVLARVRQRPLHLLLCFDGAPPRYSEAGAGAPVWQGRLHALTRCAQNVAASVPAELADGVWLRLMPRRCAERWQEYAGAPVHWADEPVAQTAPVREKVWLSVPPVAPVQGVAVVGAGIAGAATAYELARHGVAVTVLEAANAPASAASGNRQGLLYAKISAHATCQTELLLAGYGYSRYLLETLLPDGEAWGGAGVLHLDFDDREARRHRQLAAHVHHAHLYRAVSAAEAAQIAGVPVAHNALYWQQGVWLNPAALVSALLAQKGIETHTQTRLCQAERVGGMWHLHTTRGSFQASHLVLCGGADSVRLPFVGDLPLRLIRGQSASARATPASRTLKAALSGAGYIAPAWRDAHTYGASFVPNDADTAWRDSEHAHNRRLLAQLNPFLARQLGATDTGGHAAVRCDSRDHLPVVGAVGDAAAMRQSYAALAKDKNLSQHTPCPYVPNVWTNTAHGSRGLITAPVCAAETAAQILGLPHVLSARLRHALHPNRLIIGDIVRGKTA